MTDNELEGTVPQGGSPVSAEHGVEYTTISSRVPKADALLLDAAVAKSQRADKSMHRSRAIHQAVMEWVRRILGIAA